MCKTDMESFNLFVRQSNPSVSNKIIRTNINIGFSPKK